MTRSENSLGAYRGLLRELDEAELAVALQMHGRWLAELRAGGEPGPGPLNLRSCNLFRESLAGVDLRRAKFSSEERRVGKECVSTCRSRWSPYPSTTKQQDKS